MAEAVYRLLVWYCVMSLFALVLYGWDKRAAVRDRRRIPEAALIACALLGGGAGALGGMLLFRHKTRKTLFHIVVPLCLALQAAVLIHTCLT